MDVELTSLQEDIYNKSFAQYVESRYELLKQFGKSSGLYDVESKQELFGQPDVPDDPAASFDLFKNYTGPLAFALEKHFFEVKFSSYEAEKNEIDNFIKEANSIPELDAYCDMQMRVKNKESEKHEYMRLSRGFYNRYPVSHDENGLAARVYGRYFLFRKFIYDELAITDSEEGFDKLKGRLQATIVLCLQPANARSGLKKSFWIGKGNGDQKMYKGSRTIDKLNKKAYKQLTEEECIKVIPYLKANKAALEYLYEEMETLGYQLPEKSD